MTDYSSDLDYGSIVPDLMLPCQFYDKSLVKCDTPESRIPFVLICEAVKTVLNYASMPQSKRNKRNYNEDVMWFESESTQPASFVWCCDALGLDPEYLRGMLRKVRQASGSKGVSVRRIVKSNPVTRCVKVKPPKERSHSETL